MLGTSCGSAKLPGMGDMLTQVLSSGNLDTIGKLLNAAGGLDGLLGGLSKATMFLPTDEAFEKLGMDAVEDLLKPENSRMLTDVLRNHVIEGDISPKKLGKSDMLTNLNGKPLNISGEGGMIGGANILESFDTKQGGIYLVDSILKD